MRTVRAMSQMGAYGGAAWFRQFPGRVFVKIRNYGRTRHRLGHCSRSRVVEFAHYANVAPKRSTTFRRHVRVPDPLSKQFRDVPFSPIQRCPLQRGVLLGSATLAAVALRGARDGRVRASRPAATAALPSPGPRTAARSCRPPPAADPRPRRAAAPRARGRRAAPSPPSKPLCCSPARDGGSATPRSAASSPRVSRWVAWAPAVLPRSRKAEAAARLRHVLGSAGAMLPKGPPQPVPGDGCSRGAAHDRRAPLPHVHGRPALQPGVGQPKSVDGALNELCGGEPARGSRVDSHPSRHQP